MNVWPYGSKPKAFTHTVFLVWRKFEDWKTDKNVFCLCRTEKVP